MMSSVSVRYRNTFEVLGLEVLVVMPALAVCTCYVSLYNERILVWPWKYNFFLHSFDVQ